MNLNDPDLRLLLAAAGGAVAGAGIVGVIARLAFNARLKKLIRLHKESLQRAVEQERVRTEAARAEPPRPIMAGAGVVHTPPTPSHFNQFGEHQEAWDRLSDLRLAMDRLWDRPTQRNADEFSRHLEAVRTWVFDREVSLEEPYPSDLRKLVLQLEAFRDNKHGLHDQMRRRPVDEAEMAALTDRYNEVRKQFVELVESLPAVLKQKVSSL